MSTAPTFPVVRFIFGGHDLGQPGVGLGRPYTVVFDGSCKVCGRLVKLLRAWDRDRQIEVVPSQNMAVRARFPWIPDQAYAESVQMVGPGGQTWQGAAAIEQLLDVLPRGMMFGWLFRVPGVRGLADRFYKWFARNRYKFGCGEHCQFRRVAVDFQDT